MKFREPKRRGADRVKDQSVSLKLPPDVVAGLDEIAQSEGRSRNSCVSRKLAQIVQRMRKQAPGEAEAVNA